MIERRALLIGVPKCDDGTFSPISQVVRNDIQKMRSVLALSSYSIDSIGEDGQDPSGSRIRAAIRKACADAPENSVLLLYFSGHGVSIDGRDYLVPSDAYRENGVLALDSLVPAIPDPRQCRARLVVFFIDACRDAPAEQRSEGTGGGVLHFPGRGGSLVMVAGCAPGQVCHYGEDGSVFTQTLARALDRRNPARTLSGVLAEVTGEMRRTTGLGEDRVQVPDAYPGAMLRLAGETVICEGDELLSAWRRVAEDNRLWRLAPDVPSRTRAEVSALVEQCARNQTAVADRLRRQTGMVDHWFDPNYPARVIDFVASLLGDHTSLRPEEAAVLVSVPFLREAVLAEGVRTAADLRPGDFKRSYETGERTDLELTHEMYPQVVRRAEGLERRNQREAAETLVMWLVHRWLSGLSPLWQCEAGARLFDRGAALLSGPAHELSRGERIRLVETLVRAVAAGPLDAQLEGRLASPSLPDVWRGHAGVLWLAGILAADPRRLSAVVADHIGTGLELSLTSVKNAADRLRAQVRKGALDLGLICEHPAQHAAFTALAEDAQRVLDYLVHMGGLGPLEAALPQRITHEGVRPDQPGPDGSPAYQVPLTRFRLSEDKIRELLMGRQLYDDPSLAIRELYQNALDACRYRETRLEGLRRQGKRPEAWEGKVTFRQGFEEDREYIECEDNGVGMGREVLENVFANAGERFVYLQEYRAEHAHWQSLDPPLRMVSNSQFGVGVFSYFMIADEIMLVTRPVDMMGRPSPDGYNVRIASSGSLIQVTPSEDDMLGGGTRIRLYLTGDDDERISVLQTLRRLLWIAEYRVMASQNGSVAEEWLPQELRYQDESAESLKCDRDLWWVSGEGCLAADGLRTNEDVFGLVVNLREERRPQFTVDRKKLRTWDKDWVNGKIKKSLPLLMEWPGLSLSWLWEVTESTPEISKQVFDHVVADGKELQVGGAWGQGMTVSAAQVGCIPQDKEFFDPKNWNNYYARWFTAWRAGVWKDLASNSQRTARRIPHALSTEGFPATDPIDGALLDRVGWRHGDDPVPVDDVIKAVAHPEQPTADLLRRLRKFAITGLDLRALRRCPALPRTFKEEDAPVVRALAAWTPPGLSQPRVVAGWLIKTSAEMDQPLNEVLRRAKEIAPEGWLAPKLELDRLGDQICTAADAKLVSVFLNGRAPWVEDELQPDHIAHAAGELGRDIEQVLEMCDRLAPLGITVAGRELYPETFERVEVEALRHLRRIGDGLSLIQLVSIAGWAGMTIHDARAALAPLERRRILRLPDVLPDKDFAPDGDILGFINWALMSLRYSTRRQEVVPLQPCISVAGAVSGRYWRQGLASHIQGLVPFTFPEKEITNADLVRLASMTFSSVGEARQILADIYPGLPLPASDEECDGLQPWLISGHMLTRSRAWKDPGWEVRAGDIIEGAMSFGTSVGEFLAHLEPYRQLGAPLPELSSETLTDLSAWYPDLYDVDMVTLYDFEDEYSTFLMEIDALQLVQIAGRLGMTLAEAHRRLSRMTPLGLKTGYPAVDLPEEIVRWQDLTLLTVFMDGQAPCLSGPADRAHLERVSAETDESVAWLSRRLQMYAPLFALVPPEEAAGG